MCVFEPWLSSVQMMKALFFGSNVPSCVLWVRGAQAGMQGRSVGENSSGFLVVKPI